MKKLSKFSISSNLYFLLPLIFASVFRLNYYIILIGLLIIVSIYYPKFNETRFYFIDSFLALALITSNFVLLFKGGFNDVYAYLIPIAILISFYFLYKSKKENYEFNHGMWHLTSAIITILCILTYVY